MTPRFSPISFIAGVMLGILLTGVWFFGGNSASVFSWPSERAVSPTGDSVPESDAVAVVDQKAGTEVVVTSVAVPPPGVWVAVRETVGSDLGNVLGAARVGDPRTDVSIPLLRATEPNRSYAIQLYRDDNGGAFDPALNSVYVDFNTGTRVVVYFKTTE